MQTKPNEPLLGLSYGAMTLLFSLMAMAMYFLADEKGLKAVWLLIYIGASFHGITSIKAMLAED
jgi:NADH:ubiquinone oxidoreductase subunit 6 (subunit J)